MSLAPSAMDRMSFPEMYERWLAGPLFRPWAEIALDRLALSSGDRVLDIACGTGIVARTARDRLGDASHVVGVDVSPDMLAVARSVTPGIDWRQGSATALPLRDGEVFDVVVCQQGLQFFPDKAAAVGELRRALAKNGRLAVATWRSDEEIPFFLELRRIAERHLGAIVDPRYSLGDGTALEALLRDAGFQNVQSTKVARAIRFDDGAVFVRLNAMAFIGMSARGKSLNDEERKVVVEAIVADSAPVLERYSDAWGTVFEASTNLATATA